MEQPLLTLEKGHRLERSPGSETGMRVRSKEGGGSREARPAGRSEILTSPLDVESL